MRNRHFSADVPSPVHARLNAKRVRGPCIPELFCFDGVDWGCGADSVFAASALTAFVPNTVCFPLERNMPPPTRLGDAGGGDVGCVAEVRRLDEDADTEGEGLFASRACLRSLNDVDFDEGVVTEDDGGEGAEGGASVRVETGFMRSSEEGAICGAVSLRVDPLGCDSLEAVSDELAADKETCAGVDVSTILMGTRRRLGAEDEFGAADTLEPSGGETTSIGVRFCNAAS